MKSILILVTNYEGRSICNENSPINPKRGFCMVLEINMGVCPRLDFENIMLFNSLGITSVFMLRLSFYAIPLLIYDVMNDITIIP